MMGRSRVGPRCTLWALLIVVGCATGSGESSDGDAPELPGATSGATGRIPSSHTSAATAVSDGSSGGADDASSGEHSTTAADSTSGDEGSTGQAQTTGASPDDRVSEGLLVLYDFDAQGGGTVLDISGVGTPLDLQVQNEARVVWGADNLQVTSDTIIESSEAGEKITQACQATGELTVEAWVRPANVTQTGPARIVTLSDDHLNRNFTLGQAADDYVFRVRTTSADNLNGTMPQFRALSTVTTSPTHVVATRDAGGSVRIYLNSVEQTLDVSTHEGDISNWDASYRLALADELGVDERYWQGTYYLVAVYERALSADEVEQNFLAGI